MDEQPQDDYFAGFGDQAARRQYGALQHQMKGKPGTPMLRTSGQVYHPLYNPAPNFLRPGPKYGTNDEAS